MFDSPRDGTVSSDDRSIMRQVQQGHHSLFDELVRRYRTALIRVAESKLNDRALAEDVVQETLLAVFAARHSYNPEFSFSTWLWTILLNRCRRTLRRSAQHRREESLDACSACALAADNAVNSGSAGLQRLLVAERNERLHALLNEIPEVQADALRLRFFGGLQFQEIADAMDCSLGGAKLRVRSGLTALASRLQADEETES